MPQGSKFEWTPHRRRIVQEMMKREARSSEIAQALGCSKRTIFSYLNSPAKDHR